MMREGRIRSELLNNWRALTASLSPTSKVGRGIIPWDVAGRIGLLFVALCLIKLVMHHSRRSAAPDLTKSVSKNHLIPECTTLMRTDKNTCQAAEKNVKNDLTADIQMLKTNGKLAFDNELMLFRQVAEFRNMKYAMRENANRKAGTRLGMKSAC
jgi:hypothetical protein